MNSNNHETRIASYYAANMSQQWLSSIDISFKIVLTSVIGYLANNKSIKSYSLSSETWKELHPVQQVKISKFTLHLFPLAGSTGPFWTLLCHPLVPTITDAKATKANTMVGWLFNECISLRTIYQRQKGMETFWQMTNLSHHKGPWLHFPPVWRCGWELRTVSFPLKKPVASVRNDVDLPNDSMRLDLNCPMKSLKCKRHYSIKMNQ